MGFKRYLPKIVKYYFRSFISSSLNIPYNRHGLPTEIAAWLPTKNPITVIDIGASEGNFFLRIDQSYSIKAALLIEPLPNRVQELKEKFCKNSNYKIIDCAVSDIECEADFYVSSEFDYASSLLQLENEELTNMQIAKPITVKIKTKTLDNIYSESGLKIIDLVKIDVQGAEHLVLRSGLQTLSNTKIVYIEASYRKLYLESSTFFDIYDAFYQNNFRLVNVNQGYKSANGEILQSDLLFVNNQFL